MIEILNATTPFEQQFGGVWLKVYSIPSGVTFSIQYSESTSVCYLRMPSSHAGLPWKEWDDLEPSLVRKIELVKDTTLTAIYKANIKRVIFDKKTFDTNIFLHYIPLVGAPLVVPPQIVPFSFNIFKICEPLLIEHEEEIFKIGGSIINPFDDRLINVCGDLMLDFYFKLNVESSLAIELAPLSIKLKGKIKPLKHYLKKLEKMRKILEEI